MLSNRKGARGKSREEGFRAIVTATWRDDQTGELNDMHLHLVAGYPKLPPSVNSQNWHDRMWWVDATRMLTNTARPATVFTSVDEAFAWARFAMWQTCVVGVKVMELKGVSRG